MAIIMWITQMHIGLSVYLLIFFSEEMHVFIAYLIPLFFFFFWLF